MKTLLIMALLVTAANAQTTRFYAPDGRSVGTATTTGNATTFYAPERCQNRGTATTTGGKTTFYAPDGRRVGSSTR
jgi:hypothetical protein